MTQICLGFGCFQKNQFQKVHYFRTFESLIIFSKVNKLAKNTEGTEWSLMITLFFWEISFWKKFKFSVDYYSIIFMANHWEKITGVKGCSF